MTGPSTGSVAAQRGGEPEAVSAVGATGPVSAVRVRFALLALALGGFGIGVTEFVTMGLLPDIAQDLLPADYAADPEGANATAGLLVSAYALGVVVGAPAIAALAARWSRKRLLVVLVSVFVVGNLLSAVLPSFGLVLAARFLSALPHGAYFGIASLVAASLMGPGNRARGVSFVMGGLTIANVVGVPVGTFLGQALGWRATYMFVAVVFALALAAIALSVPYRPGDASATVRGELRALTRLQVWLTLAVASVGFAGLFAVYTYIAPIVTEVTRLPAEVVPWVLVVFGVGMTAGNALSGWLTDRSVKRSLTIGMLALGLSVVGFALTAATVPGLLVFTLTLGASVGSCMPALQTRLMDVARDGQSFAATLNHSALNIGNSLGAFLGGVVIAAGFGYLSPAVVGALLSAVGLTLLATSFAIDRRRKSAVSRP